MTYVNLDNANFELTDPSRDDSLVAKFIARNLRGGIHHFSLEVDSVDAITADLKNNGACVLGNGAQKNVHGDNIAIVHPRGFFRRAGRTRRAA